MHPGTHSIGVNNPIFRQRCLVLRCCVCTVTCAQLNRRSAATLRSVQLHAVLRLRHCVPMKMMLLRVPATGKGGRQCEQPAPLAHTSLPYSSSQVGSRILFLWMEMQEHVTASYASVQSTQCADGDVPTS